MRSLRTATKSSPRSPQLEKAGSQQQRPNAAKNKLINFKKRFMTLRPAVVTAPHQQLQGAAGLLERTVTPYLSTIGLLNTHRCRNL